MGCIRKSSKNFNNFFLSSAVMQRGPVIFVVISVLVAALIFGSFTPLMVFAVPPDSGWSQSSNCETLSKPGEATKLRCCWREPIPGSILGQKYCQTCTATTKPGIFNCTEKEKQSLTAPPTAGGNILQEEGVLAPLTEDESVLQQDGVLQQPPVEGIPPPITQDQGLFPEADLDQSSEDQGTAELPATTEEEPAPVCQEGLEFNEDLGFCVPTECPGGQELNEETGVCILEEPQQPVQEEAESDNEEQISDQEDSSEEDNTNN